MDVTRVGFGAWAIGGAGWAFGWSSQDDTESVAAIRHAVDRGVNWIDTAAVYGLGHSEEIVARALRDMPAGARPCTDVRAASSVTGWAASVGNRISGDVTGAVRAGVSTTSFESAEALWPVSSARTT